MSIVLPDEFRLARKFSGWKKLRTSSLTPHRSGELNAKNRELMELQALAQRRLKANRANFADGMKAAKEVKKDLEWTQKRVK